MLVLSHLRCVPSLFRALKEEEWHPSKHRQRPFLSLPSLVCFMQMWLAALWRLRFIQLSFSHVLFAPAYS